MKEIIEILNKKPRLEELILCLDLIRFNKDVAIVKFDGQRNELYYTVIVTFDAAKNKSMIRFDSSDLYEALFFLLREYSKEQ